MKSTTLPHEKGDIRILVDDQGEPYIHLKSVCDHHGHDFEKVNARIASLTESPDVTQQRFNAQQRFVAAEKELTEVDRTLGEKEGRLKAVKAQEKKATAEQKATADYTNTVSERIALEKRVSELKEKRDDLLTVIRKCEETQQILGDAPDPEKIADQFFY